MASTTQLRPANPSKHHPHLTIPILQQPSVENPRLGLIVDLPSLYRQGPETSILLPSSSTCDHHDTILASFGIDERSPKIARAIAPRRRPARLWIPRTLVDSNPQHELLDTYTLVSIGGGPQHLRKDVGRQVRQWNGNILVAHCRSVRLREI